MTAVSIVDSVYFDSLGGLLFIREVMLLGVVALRAGGKIHYDAANMKITNSKAGNDLLKREYRRGFSI